MNAIRSAGESTRRGTSFKFDHGNTASVKAINRPTCTISELMRKTKFSKEEIRHLYRTFKQDCPLGEVSKTHFSTVYATLFPSGECFRYASLLFQNIDRANTGVIHFEDLIVTLSILTYGSIEDQLSWIFDLYDLNKDGILTRTELVQMVTSIFQLIIPASKLNFTSVNNTIEERTEELFHNWDRHSRGVIYKEDFLQYCLQNETICQSINTLKLNITY